MPRFSIHRPEDAASGEFPELPGITSSGEIRSRGLVVNEICPLHLWEHALGSGARLSIQKSEVDHTFFVTSGSVLVNGKVVIPQSAVVVAHGASMELQVPGPPATILHWRRPESSPQRPAREGGQVQVVGPEGLYEFKPERAVRIWADSASPTGETWLHCSRLFGPGSAEEPHYHTADEVIYILGGSAVIGRQELGPGTAVAIDAYTTYF